MSSTRLSGDSVRSYLRDIGRIPLLEHDEEILLGRKVQKLMELEERLNEKPLNEEARERVKTELRKLRTMSPMSAEASVVRGYLDWMSHLPWQTYNEDRINIKEAENIFAMVSSNS